MSVRRRASGRVHYNYFRDYDPAKGGYIESDPIGLRGGINTFDYANSRPLEKVDTRGLNPVIGATWGGNAGTAVGAAVGGPPGALLGRIVGIGLGAGLGYLIATCHAKDPETCLEHYRECLRINWGGVIDHESACQACYNRCVGSPNKQWPDFVIDGTFGDPGIKVSCMYWTNYLLISK